MRNRFSPIITLCAAALTVAAALPAAADDTEIYIGQPTGTSIASRPNILFVMDTSGSMGTQVTTQATYDPNEVYTGDCPAGKIYWKSSTANYKGRPVDEDCRFKDDDDTTGGAVDAAMFLCMTAQNIMNVNGFQTVNRAAQWRERRTASNSRWTTLDRDRNTQVDCADDFDENKMKPTHGDGTKAYAANGTRGPYHDDAANQISWDTDETDDTYTFYTSNYLNWYYNARLVTKTRLEIVQESLKSIISTLSAANVGLMRFSTDGEGGMVIKQMEDISTSRQAVINAIDGLSPNGNTPLSETYSEALRYWRGMTWDYGSRSSPVNSIGAAMSGTNYISPIAASCQKNFLVMLTDGEPVSDSLNSTRIGQIPGFQTYLNEQAGVASGGTCTPNTGSGANNTNGVCLDDLAGFAHTKDQIPGAVTAGDQTVTTYTVGFGSDVQNIAWAIDGLKSTATRGGGAFFEAGDTASLTDAFNNIIEEILSVNTTFTAPTVAVNAFNRTQNLDDLYITVFGTPQPPSAGNKFHWPGNIKKYEIETNGRIVGSDGQGAVDTTTGFFSGNARSFWSDVIDGSDVALGGAAHEIPTPALRKLYTDVGGNTLKNNPVAVTNLNITAAMLGIDASSTITRDELIEWTRGADTDALLPADQVKPRFAMGDPLHGRPATVIYGGTEANPDLVLFAVTNDGYLHAIDTSDGHELWSYIPGQLLRRMDDLYTNDPQPAKRYGLDGNIRAYKLDINNNGSVDGADKVYLFFGMGRGGESYYALDVTDRNDPRLLWRKGSVNEIQGDGTAIPAADQLPGLAQSWSTPVITNVNIGGTVKLVAIFAGGYDPSQDNLAYNTDDIGNRIYMLDAVTGAQLWRAGPDTDGSADLKIPTNIGAERSMNNSIPSDVRVIDMDGDGLADRMYVSDTGARVWRFDIFNGQPASSLVTGGVFASVGRAGGLGTNPDDARRFYYAPDVSMIKQNGSAFINVALGSGFRGHPLETQIHDRFYAFRDHAGFARFTQAQYNTRTIIKDADLEDVSVNITPNIPFGSVGWKMDMRIPSWQGEKVLAESLTFANTIIFTTYLPQAGAAVPGSNVCVARQGRNRLYAVSALDGSPILNRDGSADASGNVSDTGDEVEDRWGDLNQSGIAPEAVILFPETSAPTCIVGVESCGVSFTNDPVRTFWFQRNTEGN